MAVASNGARAGMRSVTSGTLVMLIGSLGLVAETFVARVMLTRWLSNADWNALALGLAIAGLLSSLGALGLPSAVARNLPFAANDSERRGILASAVRMLLPTAVVAGVALSALSVPLTLTFHKTQLAEVVLFLGVAVAASILSSLFASFFQGFEVTFPNAFFNQVLTPGLFIAYLSVAWGLGGFHLALVTALGGYVVAVAASFVALLIYARLRIRRYLPSGPTATGVSRRLLAFALSLLIVGVLSYFTGYADTLVLGYFDGDDVGLYTNQLTLARLLQVGLGSLGYIFLPVAARFIRERASGALRVVYATATKWTVISSLPLFLLFFFLPISSMRFVFGPVYATGALSLQVLVLGAFIGGVVGPAMQTQVSFGQTRLLMYNTLVSAVVNIGLSFILVPAVGLLGAAIAWSASNALFAVISATEISWLERVHPVASSYLVPFVLTLVPLGALFSLLHRAPWDWTLPLLVAGAAGWYVGAILLTRRLGPGDALLLESVEGVLGVSLPRLRRIGAWATDHRSRPT